MPDPLNLATATLDQLLVEQDAAALDTSAAKGRTLRVKQEIASRFAESAKRTLTEKGKSHGSVTIPLQDGFEVKGDAKQTVKWDSAKLQAVAQTLPWERVIALFKIDFSMSETIYKGIAALSPELRAQIDAARTTSVGEPSLSLTKAA